MKCIFIVSSLQMNVVVFTYDLQ